MLPIVHCRLCKRDIDRNTEKEKEDWVMPSRNYFYCVKCYNDWKNNKNNINASPRDMNFWKEAIVDYLYNDLKMSVDFPKLNSQWASFIKPEKKMTPKGIYFAVRYYYEVAKGDKEKALGGIGIVPSIYKDSAEYWTNLENKKAGTLEAIIEQIRSREERPVKIIKRKDSKKKDKSKWSLDSI